MLFLYCYGGERSVKCVRPALEMEANKEEQRGVVHFFGGWGCWNTCNWSSHVCCVWQTLYDPDKCARVAEDFHERCTSLQDDSQPGEAHRVITPDVIARINGLIWENRRITEEQIRVLVGISHGSMHAIINDHMQFWKIFMQWVPHQLMERQTIDRMATSLSHLQLYHEEEYAFLLHIAMEDKMCCHYFEPESKTAMPTMETPQFSPSKEIHSCPYEYR